MSSLDPSLSAPSTNRRGTFSKAKSFRRAALNLEPQGTPGQPHAFRFLSGEEYSGPEIIDNIKKPININTESEEYKTPLFLGANGTLYNKYYIAIKIIGIDEPLPQTGLSPSLSSSSSSSSSPSPSPSPNTTTATNNKQIKKNNSISDLTPYLNFNSTDQIYTSFPESMAYDDYMDYEESLVEWKKQVEQNIGIVQLPHSMGRTYSRPKVIHEQLFRKNSEASNDDSISYDMERKLTDSDMKESNSSVNDDGESFSHSPTLRGANGSSLSVGGDNNSSHLNDSTSNKDNAPSQSASHGITLHHPNSGINLRERSNSDTSTGSFEGTQLDGSSPMDGSPSTGSLAGFVANGTRSRTNSITYFDQRNQRSNSLSPKHSMLQSRLADSQSLDSSMYGKMGRSGSGSGFGMDQESWFLQKDPWDSQLILTEPHPDLFSTYEEYEYAMKNWAHEVITKTTILPPHPSQFIQLPKNSELSTDDGSGVGGVGGSGGVDGGNHQLGGSAKHILEMEFEMAKNQANWTLRPIIRPIITEETMVFNRILAQSNSSKPGGSEYDHLFTIDQELPPSQIWKTLVSDEKLKITEAIDRWYRKKLTIQRQTSTWFRGGLWANHFLMPTIQSGWRDSVQKKSSILSPLALKALRRTDINSEADGKRVELSFPIPELPINFNKLLPPDMNLQYFLGMLEMPTSHSLIGGGSGGQQTGSGSGSGSSGSGGGSGGSGSGSGLNMSTSGSSGKSEKDKDKETANYIAMHSINNTTNISTKEERRQYTKILQTYEQRLQFSFRLDSLNSWSEGGYTPMELQEKKLDIEHIVAAPGFDLQTGVWSLINNSSHFLDKFQETFDQVDLRLYAPTIPILPAIVPSVFINGGGSGSGGASGSSSISSTSSGTSPNVARPGSNSSIGGGQPPSPHIPSGSSLLSSPPNRQGSTGSFSFIGSPSGGGKISPTNSSSMDSPRTPSQLTAVVERGSSPRSHSGGSISTHPNTPSVSSNTFLSLINTDSFPELLKFMDLTNEKLVLGKISSLVLLVLTSELKGTMVIENILFSKDTQSLYGLARAMSFFDAVPLDLFTYPTHLNEMLTPSIYKGSTQEVVRLVFVYYYLGIIQERLNFFCNNVGILGYINSSRKDAAERIGIQFQNDREFLDKIFIALGRKSSSLVSNCFLFVLIQLIKMSESPTVQSLLKGDLLMHIRDLSASKSSHSRFAAKRLYQILQEDPWKEFLMASYTESIKKNESQHLIDLTTMKDAPKRSIPSISLISELTFNFCTSVLENINSAPIPKPIYKFILNDSIFFQLYNSIVKCKNFTQSTEVTSRLFASLCRVLSKFNLLKNSDSIKSGGKVDPKKQNDVETGVAISPTLLFEILGFLQNPSFDNNRYGSNIKTNMLIALRQLLKQSEIFDSIKKESILYNKFLIPACRDGKNVEFNRNVWRLFFQMIRFHHGHIEYLEKSKYLNALMDIISLNAGNVVLTNALHYLCKLFSLVSYETRKNALRAPGTSAIDTKYSEKDVKSLLNFFVERSCFIKFHMIYKKLTENTVGILIDQRLLINITTFYRIISFLPSCQKLLKDTLKNPEYKTGIIQVSKMYKPSETF
ncbi:hypothetical protein RB653_004534 [Dictyostelium firmibasis]|uniref:Uncharacterized protein n=1 Tax=Dictyostelium firmibasis TaxID=79012 RepID=A0AAN7UAP3_9MYCE